MEEINTVDDDVEIVEPPAKKARVSSDEIVPTPILDKLCDVERGVNSISQKLAFIEDIKKSFECVVCRLLCKQPVVSI